MMTSQSEFDVVVVGAGPEGLAAAGKAASAGLTVALVDAGCRPGGQYWRQPAGPGVDHQNLSHLHHDLTTFRRREEDFVVHAIPAAGTAPNDTADPSSERHLYAKRLVLAPGAYDRQIPFPGWTLPGVLTVGGAQALLKGHGVVAGRRVLVAGTGPSCCP